MKKQITCIVSGRVQGVLYRAFTEKTAKNLNIKGEVRNLPNGTVEIVAEGEEENLKEFQLEIKKGSTFSKVEKVLCEARDNLTGFNDFKIKYRSFFDRF